MDKRTPFAVVSILAGMIGAPSSVSGQTISFGLIGGGSLTDAVQTETRYNTRWWSQSKDWIAGAAIEFNFHFPVSLEVDGMFRELHATWAGVEPDGTLNSVSPSPVVTWEFPVLAKYRFGAGKLRPFVEAGPAFRTTGNLNFYPSHYGVTAGAGLETHWHGLRIAPVLRYTRWARDQYGGGGSQLNQLELLASISRDTESSWNPFGSRVSLGGIAGFGLTTNIGSATTHYPVPVLGPGNTYVTADATQNITGLRSYALGPAIGARMWRGLSMEVEAIYKPLRDRVTTVVDPGMRYSSATYTQATTWQFPVLARYGLREGRVDPFMEAGPSFRLPNQNLSTHGITAGAGVAVRVGQLRISPGLRFTHWGPDSGTYSSGVRRNEASALAAFTFGGNR